MRIGIDLGGTSVKAALCADDGAILIKQGVPTKTGDPDGLRADMKQLALALCASGGVQPDEVESIGIGVPGSYDKPSCTLRFGTNLGMNDVCFAETFQPEFGCAVQLDNDANCAALGEATAGAGKNVKNMLMVTLGTGVGGGIMAVIPGVMGLAAFAPPLDSAGNSVKAQKALEYISVRLGLNIFSPARVELAAAEPVREGVCK